MIESQTEEYWCPHAQAVNGHSDCVYAGMHPVIIKKVREAYFCFGENKDKVTDCAYLHELTLLEKIANHVDDSQGGLI